MQKRKVGPNKFIQYVFTNFFSFSSIN
jgi:hypothetical protein